MVDEEYKSEKHNKIKGINQTYLRPKDIAEEVVKALLERGSKLSKEEGKKENPNQPVTELDHAASRLQSVTPWLEHRAAG